MSGSSGTRRDGAKAAQASDPVVVETVVETYDAPVKGGGWLFFAGTVLGLAGLMRIVDSIWAFSYNGALPQGLKDGVLGDSLTNYAWLWMGVGVLLIIASLLVLVGSQFGRWVGLIG